VEKYTDEKSLLASTPKRAHANDIITADTTKRDKHTGIPKNSNSTHVEHLERQSNI